MTIKQLADQYSISCATLRHYEKVGLLDRRHVTRGANGYRNFTELAVPRVRFIRLGQAAGFSLRELIDGLEIWEDEKLSRDEKKMIFHAQLARVQEKIDQMQATKAYIKTKIKML